MMKPNDKKQLLHWNDIRLVDRLATKNNMMLSLNVFLFFSEKFVKKACSER